MAAVLLGLCLAPGAAEAVVTGYKLRWITGMEWALGVNDAGQVVGRGGGNALVWDPATGMQVLGAGEAAAINTHGQVTGQVDGRPFFWDQAEGMQFIGPAGASGVALNDAGQLVGEGLSTGAFYWDEGRGMISIGAPSSAPPVLVQSYGATVIGTSVNVRDIAPDGTVLTWAVATHPEPGWNPLLSEGMDFASLWTPEGGHAVVDLATIPGVVPDAINASHQMLWHVDEDAKALVTDVSGGVSAWIGGSALLAGVTLELGHDINSAGAVVGQTSVWIEPPKASLWTSEQGVVLLEDMVDDVVDLRWALGISDTGHIVGMGLDGGAPTGFLLTPISDVPLPAGLALLPAALAGFGVLRRRG
ncbi:hypothetical protein ACQ5SO_07395 [Rhodovulum sp. DZ06]|uniref:hypothetical protein n=1 Tax=Rhodovulum sp. DZ06 TaxID=3425126 RepID=UPI003D32FE02